MTNTSIRDMTIHDFNLNVRTYNALFHAGITKIEDIYNIWLQKKSFQSIRGIGKQSEKEIVCLLESLRFDLNACDNETNSICEVEDHVQK